jgi:ketosteroid isomerase-like protein
MPVAGPDLIAAFVAAVSAADEDGAAACVTDDARFVLSGGRALPSGPAGARAFARKHAASDGRKPSVELASVEEVGPGRFVLGLSFVQREIGSDEVLYEMLVGGVVEFADGRIAALRAHPSLAEAHEDAA